MKNKERMRIGLNGFGTLARAGAHDTGRRRARLCSKRKRARMSATCTTRRSSPAGRRAGDHNRVADVSDRASFVTIFRCRARRSWQPGCPWSAMQAQRAVSRRPQSRLLELAAGTVEHRHAGNRPGYRDPSAGLSKASSSTCRRQVKRDRRRHAAWLSQASLGMGDAYLLPSIAVFVVGGAAVWIERKKG